MAFAKEVHHPGSVIPARPAREPALRAAMPIVDALARGAVDEALSISEAIGDGVRAGQAGRLAALRAAGLTGRRTGPIRFARVR
jgi:hypothetical protein